MARRRAARQRWRERQRACKAAKLAAERRRRAARQRRRERRRARKAAKLAAERDDAPCGAIAA